MHTYANIHNAVNEYLHKQYVSQLMAIANRNFNAFLH